MGEIRNAYKIFVSKSEVKTPPERTKHRRAHTIRMGLTGTEYERLDWNELAWDRV
jgi:hypothetical protein